MDGLVLALAIILNPRSKKAAQRGEQNSSASDGSGVDHGDGTAQVTAVMIMPASGGHDNKESDEEDHLTPITV